MGKILTIAGSIVANSTWFLAICIYIAFYKIRISEAKFLLCNYMLFQIYSQYWFSINATRAKKLSWIKLISYKIDKGLTVANSTVANMTLWWAICTCTTFYKIKNLESIFRCATRKYFRILCV